MGSKPINDGLCRASTGREDWPYIAVCTEQKGHKGIHVGNCGFRWIGPNNAETEEP
jgi:hypothetical protein